MTISTNALQRVCLLLGCLVTLTLVSAVPVRATDYPDLALLGEWYLDTMHGQSPAGPTWQAITMNFTENESETADAYPYSISGNAGCNSYWFGLYTFAAPNTLTFLDMPATTRMWCADAMETEEEYIEALLEMTTYAIRQKTNHRRLIMYNAAEETVLEFVSKSEFAAVQLVDSLSPNMETIYLPIVSTN